MIGAKARSGPTAKELMSGRNDRDFEAFLIRYINFFYGAWIFVTSGSFDSAPRHGRHLNR